MTYGEQKSFDLIKQIVFRYVVSFAWKFKEVFEDCSVFTDIAFLEFSRIVSFLLISENSLFLSNCLIYQPLVKKVSLKNLNIFHLTVNAKSLKDLKSALYSRPIGVL